MATLTIKNLPDEIYAALTQSARRNRRSINGEAITTLERALNVTKPDVEETLERIRKNRERMAAKGVWATDEFINWAKNEGRP